MKIKGLIPGCAAFFTCFVCSLCGHYLALLFPSLSQPWWLSFVVLIATLESAYFATYFLNPRTPLVVPLVELALWVVPFYFLWGGFTSTFLRASFSVLIPWLVARGYGAQVASMEKVADLLGDQAASTISWEYESLEHRGQVRLSTEYFWWRLWSFGLVISILAIAVQRQVPPLEQSQNPSLSFLYWGALASGLLLQGLVYLLRMQILWKYAQAQVQPDLWKLWLRSLTIFVVITVVLVSLAPINYSPVNADRLGRILAGLLNRFTDLSALPNQPVEREGPPNESLGQLEFPPEEGELGWPGILLGLAFLLIITLLVLFVLFVVGWALVALFADEVERLRGLPHLAVQVYTALKEALRGFGGWLRNLWAQLTMGGAESKLAGLKIREQSTKGDTTWVPRTSKVIRFQTVRGMFRHIVKVGTQRGLVFTATQTPAEYGQILGEYLPQAQSEVREFFHGYHRERYGQTPPNAEEQKTLLAIGAQIVEQLKER